MLEACTQWAQEYSNAIVEAAQAISEQNVPAKHEWCAAYHNAEMFQFFDKNSDYL